MVDSHATHSPDELEVVQVVFIVGPGLWANLESVVITAERKGLNTKLFMRGRG